MWQNILKIFHYFNRWKFAVIFIKSSTQQLRSHFVFVLWCFTFNQSMNAIKVIIRLATTNRKLLYVVYLLHTWIGMFYLFKRLNIAMQRLKCFVFVYYFKCLNFLFKSKHYINSCLFYFESNKCHVCRLVFRIWCVGRFHWNLSNCKAIICNIRFRKRLLWCVAVIQLQRGEWHWIRNNDWL